jgi:uncharacterized Ntn-hydrolase superfamily protein
MREVIENIAVKDIPSELVRRGLAGGDQVRVVIEPAEEAAARDITAVNAASGAFAFLGQEPELYSDSDVIERNV